MQGRIRYFVAAAAVLGIAAGLFLAHYLKTLEPRLKQRVISALEQRFDAQVQLAELHLSLFPMPNVDGRDLTIAHREWSGDQPLIKIGHFYAATDFTTILDWRNRVDKVTLEGLEVHIPPRGAAVFKSRTEANQQVSSDEPGNDTTHLKFLIETIIADNSVIIIEPKEAGKSPLNFPIEKLTMRSVSAANAMAFTARLRNAMPPGDIDTTGHFGPWQRDDPRATPISGDYTFSNANLSVFKGISGMLSSLGHFGGVLQHIEVDGSTDMPRFALKQGGGSVHLTSRFHSIVDATNGDTILNPVDASFGHSEFICNGGVMHKSGEPGKTVTLDAQAKHARMEDILALLVQGAPLLTGDVQFQSKIVIPPGKQAVADKLKLDGAFHLQSATFTSAKIEQVLSTLSDRASGISKKDESNGEPVHHRVASDFFGKFKLDNGTASFANLAFAVPGAHIHLAGDYNLKSSQIDMKGEFSMQATLSQTQSGVAGVLLKPFDRFFAKNGAGFAVPISISGTRDHPSVGVTVFHKRFDIH